MIRNALLHVPLGAARALFLLVLVALLVWVLRLPRGQTSPGEGQVKLSENLKLWTAVTLGIQIAIYALL
ncbi:MAG: hypothetical protein AB1705_25345 [Verrucomicrobiota bacterium]